MSSPDADALPRLRERTRRADCPPGPRINFVLAIVAQSMPRRFPFDPLVWAQQLSTQFGDVAFYQLGPLRVYQLNHPDLARQILVEQSDKFHKPRLLKRAFAPFAGEGLLTSDGEFWRRQRRLMQPAFHHRHLATYADISVRHAARQRETYASGDVVEVLAEMAQLTLAIVVESLFGGDVRAQAGEIGEMMIAVLDASNQRLNSALQLPAWVPTARHRREGRAIRRLDGILDELITAGRQASGQRTDLLSLLLAATDEESGARMSDRQLRDEMMTLFLAGHETTATALTWIWLLLARHPEVEAALETELDRVLGDRLPTAADLADLPYTEMIVREAMRLYPPAPGFAREPIEDVEIGGYRVPKGSLVTVNTYVLHRDARFHQDPERFDPQRFSPGWQERMGRYAYLPFGGGPRVCIGNGFAMLETRLILATLAQRWRLALEPGQDVRPQQLVTVRPRGGLRMRLASR